MFDWVLNTPLESNDSFRCFAKDVSVKSMLVRT